LLDYALDARIFYLKTQTPDLFWVRHDWTGDIGPDHGGKYDFWFGYPGFALLEVDKNPLYTQWNTTPNGVLKVPFYDGTMTSAFYNRRTEVGYPPYWEGATSMNRRLNTSAWNQVTGPPVSVSGEVVVIKQHPSFGICVNEQRAMPSGRGSQYDDEITRWDYDFMWKAQRASATEYEVQGSNMGILDPYTEWPPLVGRTNESQSREKPWSWDFRTASGSTSMIDGGSSGIWNFLD
jgi:hypothetical protein